MLCQLVCDVCRCICVAMDLEKWWSSLSASVRFCWYSCAYRACVHEIQSDLLLLQWVNFACFAGSPCGLIVVYLGLFTPLSPWEALSNCCCQRGLCVWKHISPQQMVASLAILFFQDLAISTASQPSRSLASHHPDDKILFMDWGSTTHLQVQVNTLLPLATWGYFVLNRDTSLWYICCGKVEILCAGCFFFSSVVYHIWLGSYRTETCWIETEL